MDTRFCVVGAGAIGATIGARLAASGTPTTALARGRTLDALRTNGWRLDTPDGRLDAPVTASDSPAELGPQDVVVIAVKAHAMTALAPTLGPLLGPDTVIVPALNGVPWWFFDGLGGEYDGLTPESVDPGGVIAASIPTGRVLGCVVHMSSSVVEPGRALHRAGDWLILGEPSGAPSDRLERVAEPLQRAGFRVTRSQRIQDDIWYKLWGNLTMNPIAVLTGATTDKVLDDELVNAFARAIMGEAQAIGNRIGCVITESAEDRNAVTRRLGAMRVSMLQDADAGRPLELDAMVTVVHEIGTVVGVPTPMIDALLGLTRLAARERGLYPW